MDKLQQSKKTIDNVIGIMEFAGMNDEAKELKEATNYLIRELKLKNDVIDQMMLDLDRRVKDYTGLLEKIKYMKLAIYTQHCTINHMDNTEYEKGVISGLIQASNIVNKALIQKDVYE